MSNLGPNSDTAEWLLRTVRKNPEGLLLLGAGLALLMRSGDAYRTVTIDYRGGLRYPHLERDPSTPARLDDILASRRK